ncbi:hypothetical protein HDZ31DRAFT_82906 [Schizophyllum fasciatum]
MGAKLPPAEYPASRCRIEEVNMFFECQPKKDPGQPSSIECTPVPRFFLLCDDSPAIEVTGAVRVDHAGKPVLLAQALRNLPKAKEWRQVIKRQANDS